MNKIHLLVGLSLFLGSCQSNQTTDGNTEIQYIGDTIVIQEDSPVLKQLVVESAQLQTFTSEFQTVGTVHPIPGKFAKIAPPFSGRIVKSYVQLGQKVKVGSPIFELSSSDFYEAAKTFFAAKSAAEVARKNYNRQKELAANGVASQRDLEQAESETLISEQEYEQAKATLKIFNIDIASFQMGQPLKIVSPIAGEIVKNDIAIGNYIKEDAEPLGIVADLSQVWVGALVKERYFGKIKQGDNVEVYSSGNPENVMMGTIHYVGEILDEETRSLEVIVECDNKNRELKLGMFCEVHFLNSPIQAILLPSKAIMQEEDHDFVLIETAKNTYVRRQVTTTSVNPNEVHVLAGISEGEKVVTQGGIYLN
ncbi:MAG: efflux RND transporter periplasmic adaptor subunit [Massilibacteroides sp.]|nr:efflux RND transporter periplasmic adaptor subunit [Massilibacteroides sp.]